MLIEKSFGLKLSNVAESDARGSFSGTATVYDEVDSFGDKIRAGAFSKSISDSGGVFPCLWCHRMNEVLGTVAITQDGRTLQVAGNLLINRVAKAAEVFALLQERVVKGLSVGFSVIRAQPFGTKGANEFLEGKLVEISLVPVPALASAQVATVRSFETLVRSLDPRRDHDALVALRRTIDTLIGGGGEEDDDAIAKALGSVNLRWK